MDMRIPLVVAVLIITTLAAYSYITITGLNDNVAQLTADKSLLTAQLTKSNENSNEIMMRLKMYENSQGGHFLFTISGKPGDMAFTFTTPDTSGGDTLKISEIKYGDLNKRDVMHLFSNTCDWEVNLTANRAEGNVPVRLNGICNVRAEEYQQNMAIGDIGMIGFLVEYEPHSASPWVSGERWVWSTFLIE